MQFRLDDCMYRTTTSFYFLISFLNIAVFRDVFIHFHSFHPSISNPPRDGRHSGLGFSEHSETTNRIGSRT